MIMKIKGIQKKVSNDSNIYIIKRERNYEKENINNGIIGISINL